jgi:ubiquinone/menaquinone biosynthesis C-methylase UbiE
MTTLSATIVTMNNFPLLRNVSSRVSKGYIDDLGRVAQVYESLEKFELDYEWDPISDPSITPVIRFEWEVLNNRLGQTYLSTARRILSIGGGGNSPTLSHLAKSYKYLCVLNPSERDLMLYAEKSMADERILLVRGVGEMIPFLDSSFDLVEIPATLDHCFNHKKVLEECFRVLEPGGRIVLTCGNEKSWYRNVVSKLKFPIPETHLHHHTIHLEPFLIEKMLTSVGFSEVQISSNYFLKLPKFIEKILKSRKSLMLYGWISNYLFPKVFGKNNGGMLLVGATK